jgi:hypothetical protein
LKLKDKLSLSSEKGVDWVMKAFNEYSSHLAYSSFHLEAFLNIDSTVRNTLALVSTHLDSVLSLCLSSLGVLPIIYEAKAVDFERIIAILRDHTDSLILEKKNLYECLKNCDLPGVHKVNVEVLTFLTIF